jgi:hypothetical protein
MIALVRTSITKSMPHRNGFARNSVKIQPTKPETRPKAMLVKVIGAQNVSFLPMPWRSPQGRLAQVAARQRCSFRNGIRAP